MVLACWMVTEKIRLPFDTPHCAMATEFFWLLGKGECHMFLESPCQGVRVFQKHMTRPPFMATKFFWSSQKGATKVFFITIGLMIENFQSPQD